MTARIKTQEEADLQAAVAALEAAVAALEAERDVLELHAESIRRRLTELRTLLDPLVCPCAACATAKKYAAGAS